MKRIFTDDSALNQIRIGLGDRVLDLRGWGSNSKHFISKSDFDEADQRRLDAERALRQVAKASNPFPKVVTLCGSTRFKETFEAVNREETLAGNLVISVGLYLHGEPGFDWKSENGQRVKAELDTLHKRKIDLADEILVINVGGYIGESTRSEIAYARATGKPVRFLEDPIKLAWKESDDAE